MKGMEDYRRELATIITDTVKAQNVDILASDFQLERAGNLIRISVMATAVSIMLVPSSGSAIYLNNAGALAANGILTETVALDQGRTWNLQTSNAAGITVKHLCIQEIQA